MAVNSQLTLVELAKRTHNGNLLTIAEILEESNPILKDAPFIEGNDQFSHRIVRRSALPTGTYRRINEGVGKSASSTVNVTEGLAMLEIYSEVDKVLIDTAPNPKQARMDEAKAFIEGLSQQIADAIIYGNSSTDPEQIDGLATRMATIDTNGNVIETNDRCARIDHFSRYTF